MNQLYEEHQTLMKEVRHLNGMLLNLNGTLLGLVPEGQEQRREIKELET